MGNSNAKSYTELKVGIFTLFGLVILAFIIIIVGDFHIYQRGYTINILFNTVEGLEITSPIRLSGMEVGEVKEMMVDNDKIKVVAWIRSNVPIRANALATINSLGIIGEKYIEITRGSPSARLLKNKDTLVGMDPVSVGSLLYKTEEVILNLERTTRRIEEALSGSVNKLDINNIVKTTLNILNNINTIVKENRENIKEAFVNLDNSSKTFVEAAKTTSSAIHKIENNIDTLIKENKDNIKIACTEFKDTSTLLKKKILDISTNLEKVIKNIDQLVTKSEENLNTTLENYRKSSLELSEISGSLKKIVGKIEEGKGLLGKISADDKVATSLDEIILNLNEFSEDIKKHPWKLLRK